MAQLNGGSVKITASGAIGVSAKPTTIYSYTVLSTGTAGVVILKDLNTSGIERHRSTGTISQGITVFFGANGKYFPGGAWVDVDANTTYVDFDYAQQA